MTTLDPNHPEMIRLEMERNLREIQERMQKRAKKAIEEEDSTTMEFPQLKEFAENLRLDCAVHQLKRERIIFMFFKQFDYVCVCSHCKDKKIFKVMIHDKPITGWLLSEIAREDKVELTEASAMAAGIVTISHGVCDRHGVILSKAIKNWRRPAEEKLCIQCDHIKTKCTCPAFDDGYEWLEGKTD